MKKERRYKSEGREKRRKWKKIRRGRGGAFIKKPIIGSIPPLPG